MRGVKGYSQADMPDHVYFVECATCRMVKIGFSNDPHRRSLQVMAKHLGTWRGHELTELGHLLGGRREEVALHRAFAAKAAGKEWFRLDARDMEWVRLMCWAGSVGDLAARASVLAALNRRVG